MIDLAAVVTRKAERAAGEAERLRGSGDWTVQSDRSLLLP